LEGGERGAVFFRVTVTCRVTCVRRKKAGGKRGKQTQAGLKNQKGRGRRGARHGGKSKTTNFTVKFNAPDTSKKDQHRSVSNGDWPGWEKRGLRVKRKLRGKDQRHHD